MTAKSAPEIKNKWAHHAMQSPDKNEAQKIGKKFVDKIRQEEAAKEKHPAPISPQSREKISKMDKKAEEYDQSKKK
ncbi:hypothetical protein BX666DRAFT_1962038 [Dichotomocladium elegans]|nr:hypothetical protein BX666DRAFT_1962038 [Dichotomocladium elegans]